MIAMIALLAMRMDGIPADFEYVWIGESGATMVLLSRTYFQMMLADKHVVAGIDLGVTGDFNGATTGGFNQAPDGDFVAGWVEAKRMSIWGDGGYSRFAPGWVGFGPSVLALFQYGLTNQSRGDDSWKPVLTAMIPRAETDGDFGEVRIRFPKPTVTGRVDSLRLLMGNGTGRTKMNELFWPAMPLDDIKVSGHWKGGPVTMELQDEGGRVADVTGTVTCNGIKHLIKGRRFGSRCAYGVLSINYGQPEGCGYVEWAPTPSRMQKIKDGDPRVTDQIVVGLALPADFPTGTEQVMKRE